MKITATADKFIKHGVDKDDYVVNITDKKYYRITNVDSPSTLSCEYVGWKQNTWLRFKAWVRSIPGYFKRYFRSLKRKLNGKNKPFWNN